MSDPELPVVATETADTEPKRRPLRRGRPRKQTIAEQAPTPQEIPSTTSPQAPQSSAQQPEEWLSLTEIGPIHEQPSEPEHSVPESHNFDEALPPQREYHRDIRESRPPRSPQEPRDRDGNNHRRFPNKRHTPPNQRSNNQRSDNQHSDNQRDRRSFQNTKQRPPMRPTNPPLRTPTSGVIWGELGHWDLFSDEKALEALIGQGSGGGDPIHLHEWYNLSLSGLMEVATDRGLSFAPGTSRTQLLRECMQDAFQKATPLYASGVLDVLNNGNGFIVYPQDNYQIREQSTFLSRHFIARHNLKRGYTLEVQIYPPRQGETCPSTLKVLSIAGKPVEACHAYTPFTELTPYYPLERLFLEVPNASDWDNTSMRIIDLLTPIGLGQRGLIVAPPRTGKTMLLQGIAHATHINRPDAHLIILLIDERPEEVTDFKRQLPHPVEVISSTFDAPAEQHVRIAEMVLEKARCLVEAGQHVVVLLDSITRLARAYNTLQPSSGKILSGGVEANALQEPKRFFGSARNIEGGGSLTILATALVDTGSKMDEVVFEEFKGTGNMELHLDRALVEKRLFPAINLEKSGTRKEELLYHPDELQKIYALRRALKGVPSTEAIEMLIQRVKKTPNNVAFLMNVNR